MSEETLLIFSALTKKALSRALKQIEAGITPSLAVEIASREYDLAIKRKANEVPLQLVNTLLDPVAVELQARFALDCLFAALAGQLSESEARAAFWHKFRAATLPSLKPLG